MIHTTLTLGAGLKHSYCTSIGYPAVIVKLDGSWEHTIVFENAAACEELAEFLRSVVQDLKAQAVEETYTQPAMASS